MVPVEDKTARNLPSGVKAVIRGFNFSFAIWRYRETRAQKLSAFERDERSE